MGPDPDPVLSSTRHCPMRLASPGVPSSQLRNLQAKMTPPELRHSSVLS
jgi:hypothetical protein